MPTAASTKQLHKCILDASVIVKWFSEEKNTSEAEGLLARAYAGDLEIYAPDLVIYEVANALFKGKKLDQSRIAMALEMIYNSPLQLFPPDKMFSLSSTRFMCQYGLTFYDASYVALAHVLQAPLISANTKDHKKIAEIEIIEL